MAQLFSQQVLERSNPDSVKQNSWQDKINKGYGSVNSIPILHPVIINRADPDVIIWLKADYGINFSESGFVTSWSDYSSAGNNCDPNFFGMAVVEGATSNTGKIFDCVSSIVNAQDSPLYSTNPAKALALRGTIYQTITGLNRVSDNDNILTMIAVVRIPYLSGAAEYSPITFVNPNQPSYGHWRGIGCDDYNYPDGRPGWGLAIRGPGMYMFPTSAFDPGSWNVIIYQVNEEAQQIETFGNNLLPLSTFNYSKGSPPNNPDYVIVKEKNIEGPGSYIGGGRSHLVGDNTGFAIAEIIALRRSLTLNEIEGMRNYFRNKYGL